MQRRLAGGIAATKGRQRQQAGYRPPTLQDTAGVARNNLGKMSRIMDRLDGFESEAKKMGDEAEELKFIEENNWDKFKIPVNIAKIILEKKVHDQPLQERLDLFKQAVAKAEYYHNLKVKHDKYKGHEARHAIKIKKWKELIAAKEKELAQQASPATHTEQTSPSEPPQEAHFHSQLSFGESAPEVTDLDFLGTRHDQLQMQMAQSAGQKHVGSLLTTGKIDTSVDPKIAKIRSDMKVIEDQARVRMKAELAQTAELDAQADAAFAALLKQLNPSDAKVETPAVRVEASAREEESASDVQLDFAEAEADPVPTPQHRVAPTSSNTITQALLGNYKGDSAADQQPEQKTVKAPATDKRPSVGHTPPPEDSTVCCCLPSWVAFWRSKPKPASAQYVKLESDKPRKVRNWRASAS
jgi:hypothetical protein